MVTTVTNYCTSSVHRFSPCGSTTAPLDSQDLTLDFEMDLLAASHAMNRARLDDFAMLLGKIGHKHSGAAVPSVIPVERSLSVAPEAASIYTNGKFRNGLYVHTYVSMCTRL